MILTDIINEINESIFIIAEISPNNANVYYELGYSHAKNKPTILIAQKGTELPFDVLPFRIIFYEDSIVGKRRIEEDLEKNIISILNKPVEALSVSHL
jgi:hypothetical protein